MLHFQEFQCTETGFYKEKQDLYLIKIPPDLRFYILANYCLSIIKLGLLWWFSGKESACQSWRQCKRCSFDFWVRKILWRRAWQPTSVFLSGEAHGQRSLVGYSPQGRKELAMTEAIQHACMHEHSGVQDLPAELLTASLFHVCTSHLSEQDYQVKHRE